MKFWLKSCPRCAGDLALKPDVSGSYVECVQCGLELNAFQTRALLKHGYVPACQHQPAPPVLIEGRRHSA